jgi:hypothetical protein
MEPTPPIKLPLFAFAVLSVGVYVFFAAVVLETYLLVPVAVACFAAPFAPALKLLRAQR